MARIPMVTRTIQTTEVTCMCLDVVNGEPIHKSVILPRTYKDDESALKAAASVINTDEIKAVVVVKTEVHETLYGMSEQDFIKYAHVMPKRNENNETNNENK